MRKLSLAFLLLALANSQVEGNHQVDSYSCSLKIFPQEQSIEARTTVRVSVDPNAGRDMMFYLHKELSVESIESDFSIHYQFAKMEKSPYRWMKDARPLHIKLAAAEKTKFEFEITYQGRVKDLSWKTTNMITEPWIELGNYSAWFPYNPDYGSFLYDVHLSIDPAYKVTGMGNIEKTDRSWQIVQTCPCRDIVIVASKKLKTLRSENQNHPLRIDYVFLTEAKARETIDNAAFIAGQYRQWFGDRHDLSFTIVVVPPFADRGSYYRKGFMALSQPDPDAGISFRLISHEIAHEWWSGAPTDNFEDWLNESFAEYSALMAIREKFGSELYRAWLDYKEFEATGAPPIIPPDPSWPKAHSTLYAKGPLVLHRLESRIGKSSFLELLREIFRRDVKSTVALLNLLEELGSRETREWFEGELNK